MKKQKDIGLDFEIDKLTNSIENVKSKDSFPTEISLLTRLELNGLTKKNGWQFNWDTELKNPIREIYKLTIANNPLIIQGVVSLEVKADHVYMHLVESAPFNIGKSKTYLGVPGNLVAFACKLSFQRGGEGYVSFLAKTKLIEHYEKSLGATHLGGQNMVITTEVALKLTNKYFK
ncbi:hypothetical protein EZJ43_10220 [Pedobacter changchengzhani]|uniref:Uncharacterized protein n=1 Tax=Pedobacter changchengzhani TaxID=2529274 RepID=A0A4R5MK78_9SPHI|nr:hypothetical protein [Pedobacter changchengzhani]TDG36050.1 hypothetical protein EZJ43_10220 [Pedobacter changchengzhani]